jgi:hypothetical protein
MTKSQGPLISMSEIASLAKVKRPVVTTWRRRHQDFPVPAVGHEGQQLFRGSEVADWLIDKGLGNADATQVTEELALYSMVAHATRYGAGYLTQLLGSLLCLRQLSDKPLLPAGRAGDPETGWAELLRRAERMDPDDEFVLRELRAANSSALPLAEFAEELVEAAYTPHGAYECLLACRARLGFTELAEDALAPELLGLVTQVADVRARLEHQGQVTIADPHARAGDLLVSLLRETDEPENLQALAADPQSWLTRLTRRRLLLGGVQEYGLDVQTGRDLEERLADPDVIATRLPYQPSEARSVVLALDEIERIGDLLGPGSTAVIIGPADALIDRLNGTEEARRRSALIRSKIVEAVVNLPGGAFPYRPGYRSAMWILTRDPIPTTSGYVLLADISTEPLNGRVQTRLAEDILLWRAEGHHRHTHDPRYGRIVPIAELERDFRAPLTPPGPPASQLLARTVSERPALIAEAEGHLERAVGRAHAYASEHGRLHSEVIQRAEERTATTTIGALVRSKRVAVFKGHRIDPEHLHSEGHHKVLGLEEVRGTRPIGSRLIDRRVFAEAYEHAAFTAPGDLIYTIGSRLDVLVDHDGFSVAAFPARVLRLIPTGQGRLTPRVLAALLGAARNTSRSPSAVRASRRIEDFTVPDLDPEDIVRLDALLADIEHRQQLLRAQADALTEIHTLTVAGFADGTLTLDPADRTDQQLTTTERM